MSHSFLPCPCFLCTSEIKYIKHACNSLEDNAHGNALTSTRNSIFRSSTSSARWFRIFPAESKSKCCSVRLSCRGRLWDSWSQLKASFSCCHTIVWAWISKHLGLPEGLLFWMLFLNFFMLCLSTDRKWRTIWKSIFLVMHVSYMVICIHIWKCASDYYVYIKILHLPWGP